MLERREIGSYEALPLAREAWEARIKEGGVSYEDIWNWVLTIDDAGAGSIPTSMGMTWILRNPEMFEFLMVDVTDFLDQTIEVYSQAPADDPARSLSYRLLNCFIISNELVSMIRDDRRLELVSWIYTNCGARNHAWLVAAILNGIGRNEIAQMIIDRLRVVEVKRGMANDVHEFLRLGSDSMANSGIWNNLRLLGVPQSRIMAELSPDKATHPHLVINAFIEQVEGQGVAHNDDRLEYMDLKPWWMLDNDQLVEAIEICAEKSPNEVLRAASNLRLRLPVKSGLLIAGAALGLTNLRQVPMTVLEELPHEAKRAVALRLDPIGEASHWTHYNLATFLLSLCASMDKPEARKFFREVVLEKLGGANTMVVYRAWRRLKLNHADLEHTLRSRLEDNGFLVGTVVRDTFHNRRIGRDEIQMAVKVGSTTFIHERGGHRYYPCEGDEVIFKADGRRLTPYVVVVYFTPIFKDIRD